MWLYHTKHYHQNNIYVNVIFIIIIIYTHVALSYKIHSREDINKNTLHFYLIMLCHVSPRHVLCISHNLVQWHSLSSSYVHPHHVPMAPSSCSYGSLIIFLWPTHYFPKFKFNLIMFLWHPSCALCTHLHLETLLLLNGTHQFANSPSTCY